MTMQNQAIRVRAANEGDIDSVAAVTASALKTLRLTYRPPAAATARREQTASRRQRLVAEIEDQVCGTVEYELKDDSLHLMALAVTSAHRKRGIARRLIEHLAVLAAGAGKPRLSLYTIAQTGNVAVFERLGFQAIREEPAVDLVSETVPALSEVYMVKVLGSATF
jgi:predicted N-acetyltransferase YhbS